ncbi:MAG: dihydrolipoyl dehydrogenase [Deltaproteobacteria bacterium]|nr:dihydrolipoyl dehydrogenase [Deltaproteobacteria bacterium]
MTPFDIAIIGGGPGGYAAAIRAAQKGAQVCLVEKGRVGGTCLHRGCIPVKTLYATARRLVAMKHLAEHGIQVDGYRFDSGTALRRKDAVVSGLEKGIEGLLKSHGVELLRGEGTLEGPGQVRIRCANVIGRIQARSIIIASGARPFIPPFMTQGGDSVLTSDEFLNMEALPKRLLIVGGGYIGCELAGIAALFGGRVTLVEQLPELLSGIDRPAVREMEKNFQELGVEVLKGTAVQAVVKSGASVLVKLAGQEKELEVDKVLVAVGRRPNSANLGLEEAGVVLRNGAVAVDAGMRTSVDNVYAIGDVTNILQLAHVADYQGEVAVENALGGKAEADYRIVPATVFTFPEIAQVGLSEKECREKKRNYRLGSFAYQASGKAQCDGETKGAARLLAAAEDGRILGGLVYGAEASALIAEVATAMRAGMSVGELAGLIHAHPTLNEIIKEAAADVLGAAVHKVGRRNRSAGSSSGETLG